MLGRRAIVGALFLVGAGCGDMEGRLTVGRLRWDAHPQPLGFVQFEPRLSWALSTVDRSERQIAYQVLVASSPEKLRIGRADIWDSNKVASSESINIHYGGSTPSARQRAFWTVRVWGRDGKPSPFAAPAWWEMGLYDEEWEGKWIGRPRRPGEKDDTHDRSVVYLRKSFTVSGKIERARLYSSAFGLYEIDVNGERAGEDVLAPGFTDYEKRVLFQAHDVTPFVREGENVIGAIVGGGWCTAALGGRSGACGFEPPRAMLQLEVTMSDGTLQTIVSDESWTSHGGPLVTAHLYDGEKYDARLEMPGWSTPAYDARDWGPVQQYDKEKERDLVADPGPPIRVTQDLAPIEVSEPRPGVYVFDFGQNIAGWAKLTTEARAGASIILHYAEALRADGTAYVDNLRGARATDEYIARGQGSETWEPRFSVHGFRYVEVHGLAGRPSPATLHARVVHSVMPRTGTLETSNARLNQLFENIVWSQRGAFLSVPTTGPQRDERLGSMLEAQAFAYTACLNNDVQMFYRKWVDDIRDAQQPNAAYSDTAPLVHRSEGVAGVAGVLVPWAFYRCYADRTSLDAHLPSMGRWLELLRSKNPDSIWRNGVGEGPGDPLEIGPPTDKALVATAELVRMGDALAQMVRSAGPNLEPAAHRAEEIAQGARAAFARAFVLPDGRLKSDTQSAYALAIDAGVLTGQARDRAGEHLARVVERDRRHLSTGVVGTAHLLPALSAVGRDDLAYALLLQESCPSWLCSIDNGATTIWERWDGFVANRGFRDATSNSFNHYAFGAVGEWMYDAIGGIALDPRAPAGRHVFVRPRPGGGLTHARARFESLYGPIATDWTLDAGTFHLAISIPPGSTATVTLPFAGKATEGGTPLARVFGLKVLETGGRQTVVAVESGTYDFSVAVP